MVLFIFFQLWLATIAGLLIAGFTAKKSFFYGIAGVLMLLMAASLEAEGVQNPNEIAVRITEVNTSTNDVNYFYEIRTVGNDGFIFWFRLVFFPVGIFLLLTSMASAIIQMLSGRKINLFGGKPSG